MSLHADRYHLTKVASHLVNIYRLDDTTTPYRHAAIYNDWRCTFSPTTEDQYPVVASSGVRAQYWSVWGVIYPPFEIKRGDQLQNLRNIHTRRVVKDKLNVIEVIPVSVDNVVHLVVSDSGTR